MRAVASAPSRTLWRIILGPDRLLAEGIVVLVLLGWFLAAPQTPDFILPAPGKVVALTWRMFVDPSLMGHTFLSLARVLAAVIIAHIIGGALVVAAHYVPVTRLLIDGRITPFLNAFPTLGWAIMAIFWFGVSTVSVVFVEVAILLPFCIINLAAGFEDMDPETLEMARSFTRKWHRVLRLVVFPMLLPYLLASTRMSYGVAWKVALIAELFGASKGLGYLINYARSQFDSTTLFATVLAIILLAILGDRVVLAPLERRAFRHRVAWAR